MTAETSKGSWKIVDLRDNEEAYVYFKGVNDALILRFSALRPGRRDRDWIEDCCYPVVNGLTYLKKDISIDGTIEQIANFIFGEGVSTWAYIADIKYVIEEIPRNVKRHLIKTREDQRRSESLSADVGRAIFSFFEMIARHHDERTHAEVPVEAEQLKKNDVKVPSASKSMGTCGICRDEVFAEQPVTICHKCKKPLHSICLVMWLKKSLDCPLCRTKFAQT